MPSAAKAQFGTVIWRNYQGILLRYIAQPQGLAMSFYSEKPTPPPLVDIVHTLAWWGQLKHPNILPLPSFSFVKDGDTMPVWLWLPSTINLLTNSSLKEYLRMRTLDESSHLALALIVARVFLDLAQHVPVRQLFSGNFSRNIMVQDGNLIFYPLFLDRFEPTAPRQQLIFREEEEGYLEQSPAWGISRDEQAPPEHDVWFLGCLLTEYFWNNDLHRPDSDVETLLHDCKAEIPKDRPTIQECVRRIEAMIEARKTGAQAPPRSSQQTQPEA